MKIVNIHSYGMVVRDKHKKEHVIDFAECNENWIQYHRRMKNLSEVATAELRASSRCVGQRDICGKPPYFEFFTCPVTRIECTTFWSERTFGKIRNSIEQAGWSTFDLS